MVPTNTATRFDIASVSKQFTAAAVLLLSFDGAVALTDPLAAHVSGLPGWADRVTIDQLIHHISGIPDYDLLPTQRGIPITTRTTQQDALDALDGVTDLKFEPGPRTSTRTPTTCCWPKWSKQHRARRSRSSWRAGCSDR